jgi:hypothetical protein
MIEFKSTVKEEEEEVAWRKRKIRTTINGEDE